MATAQLHVTKLAAAKRQAQAAIRMFFLGEDDLAIHTVASAAYGLIKDLKKARGKSEAEDVWSATIFAMVREYRRGVLQERFRDDPATLDRVRHLAAELDWITADSQLPDDFSVSGGPSLERMYWTVSNRASNFLKHADKDCLEALPMGALNNELLLMKCISSYSDIAPDDLGDEAIFFHAFMAAKDPEWRPSDSRLDSLIESIRATPVASRGMLCYKSVVQLAEDE